MRKEGIIKLPNPLLLKPSRRIGVIDDEIKQLTKTMMATTLDWEDHRPHEFGVAMAAVQIGQPYRLIVVRSSFENKKDRQFEVFVNPEITKYDGEPQIDTEGCLSVPDFYGEVPRYPQVKVRAQDLQGKPLRLTANGFLARVLQHEIDHLQGKLFTHRVKNQRYLKLSPQGELIPLSQDEIASHSFLR